MLSSGTFDIAACIASDRRRSSGGEDQREDQQKHPLPPKYHLFPNPNSHATQNGLQGIRRHYAVRANAVESALQTALHPPTSLSICSLYTELPQRSARPRSARSPYAP